MRFHYSISLTAVTTALFFFALLSCRPVEQAAGRTSQSTNKLTVITPHWEGIRKEYDAGFKRWLSDKKKNPQDIQIEWLTGQGSTDILRLVDADFKSKNRTDIDIAFGGGLENFLIFKQRGYLEKVIVPGAEKIPLDLRGIPVKDKDGRWYGAALSAFGLMYNKLVIQREHLPVPKTWADLANPEYRRRVGVADPRHSGSFLMMCEIMLQANGWDNGWKVLTGMIGNARSVAGAAGQLPRDIARGELALAPVIDFYARQEISQASNGEKTLGYTIPASQTVITPDPIAVLKGSSHLKAASLFLEYTLSEGQKLLVLPKGSKDGPRDFFLGRLAVLPGLYSNKDVVRTVGMNPFEQKGGLRYDEKKGSLRRTILSDMIGTLLIDNRTALQRAWSKVRPGQNYTALARPPISEKEALSLAAKWDDPTFRNETLAKWAQAAREKYQRW